MTKKITFFPLGNADTSLIQMNNGRVALIDYANKGNPDDKDDKRCDLPKELNERVTKKNYDVVCFTHLDDDHINGSSSYFHLDHAKKYQDGGRKKIDELWIPASALTEEKDICKYEAKIIQAEARYRFRKNYGIRVFSRPKKLKDWCKKNGIDYESRKHLIVDAGKVVPTFNLVDDGVEFFVQSPFVATVDNKTYDRNHCAITLHATFNNSPKTKVIFGADINWEVWDDIIKVTKYNKNEEKLEWDIFHISHHCSYTALSDEKGKTKTNPTDRIKWLFEEQGRANAYIVSPSKPISVSYDETQPPHKQAANYYKKDALSDNNDYFKVTMDFPTKDNPKPMTFEIKDNGVTLVKSVLAANINTHLGSRRPPRAGSL